MILKKFFLNIYKLPYTVMNTKKNYFIFLYNNNTFIIFNCKKEIKIFFNKDCILFKGRHFFLNNFLQSFISQFFFYKNLKIKFLGKGFKIKKKKNKSVQFVFNRSHITTV